MDEVKNDFPCFLDSDGFMFDKSELVERNDYSDNHEGIRSEAIAKWFKKWFGE